MSRETSVKGNGRAGQDYAVTVESDDQLKAFDAALDIAKEYARQRPEVVVLWAFGIGFVLGWKLKPW